MDWQEYGSKWKEKKKAKTMKSQEKKPEKGGGNKDDFNMDNVIQENQLLSGISQYLQNTLSTSIDMRFDNEAYCQGPMQHRMGREHCCVLEAQLEQRRLQLAQDANAERSGSLA
jgi:hypothetical protein